MSGYHRFRPLSRLLLLGSLIILLFVAQEIFQPSSANALINQLEEAPGQMLYQSREALRVRRGNTWQAIAYKRVSSEGTEGPYLRLVGFPGVTDIDQTQPLQLTTSLGMNFEVANISRDIFKDRPLSANIAQYDLQAVLPDLEAAIPLRLNIPTTQGNFVKLSVSPQLIEEWKAIAEEF